MIGGYVLEVRPEGETTLLRVMQDPKEGIDELCVRVEVTSEAPAPGDTVWWQGRSLYWTPKDRRFVDRNLPRVGYSYNPDHLLDR